MITITLENVEEKENSNNIHQIYSKIRESKDCKYFYESVDKIIIIHKKNVSKMIKFQNFLHRIKSRTLNDKSLWK